MAELVRVWVSGIDSQTARLVSDLRERDFSVASPESTVGFSDESDAIRWADVVVIAARGEELNSEQAFVYGLAVAARRSVLFIGPSAVRYPAVTAGSYTLLEPVESDAVAFQVHALGHKRASQRSKRDGTTERTLSASKGDVVSRSTSTASKAGARRPFESLLEATVFQAFQVDLGISQISMEDDSTSYVLNGTERVRVDFLIWVEGAAPFNPVPVEVGGGGSPARALDRLFEVLAAGESTLGVLVTSGQWLGPTGEIEREGRVVIVTSDRELANSETEVSKLVRSARNRLVHGGAARARI